MALQGLHYKHTVSSKFTVYNTNIPKCRGGRWRYKLIVSYASEKLKFTNSTTPRYRKAREDIGVTNL